MPILDDKIDQFEVDMQKAHEFIHGGPTESVQTEGGPLRTLAKFLKDNQDLIDSIPPALDGMEKVNMRDQPGGYVGLSGRRIRISNALGSIFSLIASVATQQRSYILPDQDGVIAMKSDIGGENSGVNTGDETKERILEKLGITDLSGTNTGDQTLEQLGGQPLLGFNPIDSNKIGAINGVAPLDDLKKIPAIYLPSFVDDVLEYDTKLMLPVEGERGKIYVVLEEDKTYRWSGSIYIELVSSPGSTDAIPEGAVNRYFTEARVLDTLLGTLAPGTNAVIQATDKVVVAFAKLQKQISDLIIEVATKAPKASPAFTGTPQVPSIADNSQSDNQAAPASFVQNVLSAAVTVINAQLNTINNLISTKAPIADTVLTGNTEAETIAVTGAVTSEDLIRAWALKSKNYIEVGGGATNEAGRITYKDGNNAFRWMTGMNTTVGMRNYQLYDLANNRLIYDVDYGTGVMTFSLSPLLPLAPAGDNSAKGASTAWVQAQRGIASGLAPLGADSKIPALYLPSFVDDVLEYVNLAGFPGTGEVGKIYVALDSNKTYRWGGSSYTEISPSPGSTDAVPEGIANRYFTEGRVLSTFLTGISFGSAAKVLATDSIIAAIGKLQAQFNAMPYDIAGGMGGKPVANDVAMVHVAIRPFSIAAGTGAGRAVVAVAPGASYVFALFKNTTQIGTISFAAGATVGTVSISSATTFVAGDTIKVVGQATADASLSDLVFSIAATLS